MFLIFLLLSSLSGTNSKKREKRATVQKDGHPKTAKRPQQEGIKDILEEIRRELKKEFSVEEKPQHPTKEEDPFPKPIVLNQSEDPLLARPYSELAVEKHAEDLELDRNADLAEEMKRLEAALEQKERFRSKENKTDKGHPSLDPSNIVEGILWSEILGPPRAKRPFPTGSNRR